MTKRGEVQAWMREAADAAPANECVRWPFTCTNTGNARAWNPRTRRMDLAYRVIWELVHEAPFPAQEARHTCGNGGDGCVNHWHILPGTHAENMSDRREHGRDPIGSAHGRSILDETDIQTICAQLSGGAARQTVAREFGVTTGTISDIWRGKSWKHVDCPRLVDNPAVCKECGRPLSAKRHARKSYCGRECVNRHNGRKRTQRLRAARTATV